MSEWKRVTVEQIAAPGKNSLATGPFGSAISARYFVEEGVPVIRGSNLSLNIGERMNDDDLAFIPVELAAKFARSRAVIGDLVFTCWGTVGQVGLIDDRALYDEYIVSNKQMKLTPDPAVADPLFLYYAFSNPQFVEHLQGISIGSSVPGFNLGQLKTMDLMLPSLGEQEAIVAVLGALDEKITVNDQIASNCNELADLIYQATATGSEEVPLSSLVNPILGGTPDRAVAEYWGHGNLWASAKDVTGAKHGIVIGTAEEITDRAIAETKAKPIPKGSVILTARGTVGAVARVGQPTSFNQTCYAFIPEKLPSGVLYLTIRSAARRMLSVAHGSVFSTVTKATFNHIYVPGFTAEETSSLEVHVAPLLTKSELRVRESLYLAALRDTLLPKLMSGQIRVRDAEKVVEDAVLWAAGCRKRRGNTSSWTSSGSWGGSRRKARRSLRALGNASPGMR